VEVSGLGPTEPGTLAEAGTALPLDRWLGGHERTAVPAEA